MQVLDGTYGQSAAGVHAYLERASGNGWVTVCDVETNSRGRVEHRGSGQLERGIYRVVFDSDRYFGMLGAVTAYPEVVVIFRLPGGARTFQVQVTLSPYSYSTHFSAMESAPEGESRDR
jgi:5-hydroxyisourate hydrolase